MKQLFHYFLILFFSTLPVMGQETQRLEGGVIHFDMVSHLMLVDCHINRSPDTYRFIVDTGAVMAIDKSLADHLQLKQQGPMAKIDHLTMDGVGADRIFAVTVFPLQHLQRGCGITIHGIIGSNFLERYVVTLD